MIDPQPVDPDEMYLDPENDLLFLDNFALTFPFVDPEPPDQNGTPEFNTNITDSAFKEHIQRTMLSINTFVHKKSRPRCESPD